MRVRVTKLDEFQFLTCLKHRVWGSRLPRFKDWQQGDHLCFIIDKAVAGLARVSGSQYKSDELVWDNGLFPYRIPIEFVHVLLPERRPPVLGAIRDALTAAWGPSYGWGIIGQLVLPDSSARVVLDAILERPNDLSTICADLDRYLAEAKLLRDADLRRRGASTPPKSARRGARKHTQDATEQRDGKAEDSSIHSKAQALLIQLGRIAGCSVWVASNDRHRPFKGKSLGDGCLESLPNFGLSKEAASRIALIDVIWIRQNAPVCAFEVETTTSVYSGLLRMSDLLSVVPALNIKLFIVAPKERQDKVMAELGRPTFQKIGLSEFCRFISTEALDELLSKVEGLAGHVQPTIIETLAVGLEEAASELS